MPRKPRASGTPLFQIELDKTGWIPVRTMLLAIDTYYAQAMTDLTPEFGAYMPYSVYQEIGRRSRPMRFRPHIVPAIFNNLDYIIKRVSSRIAVQAQMDVNAGKPPSLTQARTIVKEIWEDSLNALPREQAFASAPVEFGFHRASLKGYGQSPSDAEVGRWQRKWMKERAARINEIRRERKSAEGARRRGVAIRLGALIR